jgi:hypothetical protein
MRLIKRISSYTSDAATLSCIFGYSCIALTISFLKIWFSKNVNPFLSMKILALIDDDDDVDDGMYV